MSAAVLDDAALLDRMMAGLAEADPKYQPTNYWQLYQAPVLDELRDLGLSGFRRRRHTLLDTFGATDTLARAEIAVGGRWSARLSPIARKVFDAIPGVEAAVSGLAPGEITAYFFERVREKCATAGLDMARLGTSAIGDPEDLVEIEGQLWSIAHLQHCAMIADALRNIPFREDTVFCELGAGMGRTVEALARQFHSATLLLFDIPPQLYVAHQYLTAVFGPRVLPYGTLGDAAMPEGAVPAHLRGRIIVEPSWRFPAWRGARVDLFWNSASFQEMEPDVVANYLGGVSAMAPAHVYINALPKGNYWGERRPGSGGTRQPVTDRVYQDSLAPAYRLARTYSTDYFMRAPAYRSYIFEREGKQL